MLAVASIIGPVAISTCLRPKRPGAHGITAAPPQQTQPGLETQPASAAIVSPLSACRPEQRPASTSTRPLLVTAYCPCERCCGRWARTPADRRRTAGGYRLTDNGGLLVAADPAVTFGTVVDVPGYGRAIVADRGRTVRGDRIDVFFPTHQAAVQWGVRRLGVSFAETATK